jgi:hypothetical protein
VVDQHGALLEGLYAALVAGGDCGEGYSVAESAVSLGSGG